MRKFLIAAAAIAAVSAGSASAADLGARPYAKAPVIVAPIYDWTGFYIGAQVGGANAKNNWDLISLTNEPVSHSKSSITGGGHIGYNWQVQQFVFGLEGEFNGTNLNASSGSINSAVVTYGTKIDWYGTIVGRLGLAFDRFLVYGTGGVAFTDVKTTGVNGVADAFSNTGTRTGWTAGAGVAYQVSPNWVVGVDYKHLDFGNFDRNGTTQTLLFPYAQTGINSKIDQVTARLSYKFGGPVVAKY